MAPEGMQSKRGEELLKRYDKNGDGKLDDDERADAKEAIMQEQIERQMKSRPNPAGSERFRSQTMELFDKNRDGRIDDEERGESRQFAEKLQAAFAGMDSLTKRFDQNANGRIDPEERTQIDEFLAELRDFGAGRARSDLMREFDRNTDGRIDAGEMVEMEKFIRPRIDADPAQVRRHDKNSDGKLDAAEWQAARVTIMQWMNATPAAPQVQPPQLTPRPQEERARLEAISKEVARRRAEREKATGIVTRSPEPALRAPPSK